MNPYEILEIEIEATSEEVKKAYRKLSMKHHPDQGGDETKFIEINLSYRILSDPEKRKIYDRDGIIMDESPEYINNVIKSRLASILESWLDAKLKGEKVPMKQFFQQGLDRAISQIKNANADFNRKIEKLKHIRENVTCKAESNMLYHMIDERLKTLHMSIEHNKKEEQIFIGLKEAVKDYDFKESENENLSEWESMLRSTFARSGSNSFSYTTGS